MTRQKTPEDLVFHALGDRNRRSMLASLAAGPSTASRLSGPLALTLAATLQHLQILERAQLIRTEKTGRLRVCTLDPNGLRMARSFLEALRLPAERQLTRLRQILAE